MDDPIGEVGIAARFQPVHIVPVIAVERDQLVGSGAIGIGAGHEIIAGGGGGRIAQPSLKFLMWGHGIKCTKPHTSPAIRAYSYRSQLRS